MLTYAFWNNKGGTGKTSLAFQTICRYAEKNSKKRILALDVCPQANLSELFLGALTNNGGSNLLKLHGFIPRCSIGGYFESRLPSPYIPTPFDPYAYITTPSQINSEIPENIDLVCGDPLLELQANSITTMSNTQAPSVNTWAGVITWIKNFLDAVKDEYDTVFIDCNPSFSIYTQIALAACDRLILPVMADDSSRRAVQNALSLVYGLSLPSPIYTQHAFHSRMRSANLAIPMVHLIAQNRITQYMGEASAYAAVLKSIETDLRKVLRAHPSIFTFAKIADGKVSIRDFQTTGVVAFARGLPFSKLKAGKQDIGGHRVQVKEDYRLNVLKAIDTLVAKL